MSNEHLYREIKARDVTIEACNIMIDKLRRERDALRSELAGYLAMIVTSEGLLRQRGEKMAGWWCSQGVSDVCEAGDRLVEFGLWERSERGHGRVQFYRPREQGACT